MVQKKRANQQQADRHYNRNTGKMKSLVPRRNRIEIQKDRKTRSKISRKLLLSFSVWIMHWIMEERKKWTESEANKTKRKQKWTIFLFFLCISTKAQAATRWSECFAHLLNNFFLSFFVAGLIITLWIKFKQNDYGVRSERERETAANLTQPCTIHHTIKFNRCKIYCIIHSTKLKFHACETEKNIDR